MFRIDQLKDAGIPDNMYDEAIKTQSADSRFSILPSFAGNQFYKKLTPPL